MLMYLSEWRSGRELGELEQKVVEGVGSGGGGGGGERKGGRGENR